MDIQTISGSETTPQDIQFDWADVSGFLGEEIEPYPQPEQQRQSQPVYEENHQVVQHQQVSRVDRWEILRNAWISAKKKLQYRYLFYFLLAPATVLTLIFLSIQTQKQTGQIDTPMSITSQEQTLSASVSIMLDQPIVTPNGNRAATIGETMEAAKQVLAWQEDQLLQRKVNELTLSINIGIGTPDHICYQLSVKQCLDKLQYGSDLERQDALLTGNTDVLIRLDQMNRVYDRIRNGETEVAQYQPDLYKLARIKFLWGLQQQDQQSPNGQAQLLQLQQQLQNGSASGLRFNPQTGKPEPIN